MSALSIERLGHVNNIVSEVKSLRGPYVDIFGADVFSDWTNSEVGSANSLLLVSDTCVEIFGIEDEESILGKYLRRHGPGWHSLEWTVPSQPEAEEVVKSRNIRITDRADDAYAWLHPKQCHGLLVELSTHHFPGDSRDKEGWTPRYWSEDHPLGVVGLNCIRVMSHEPPAAAEWLADLTATDVSYDEPRPGVSGRAVGVALPGHVIEFFGPTGEGPTQDLLASRGERIHSVTFDVKDIDAALAFLSEQGIGTRPGTADGRVFLDEGSTAGSLFELASGS
jgi:catechol 2,3-dioxygenase-like lactoylglutathione lyase family enzyme